MILGRVGGTIVLNRVKPPSSCAHRNPLDVVATCIVVGIRIGKGRWQIWRSVRTACGVRAGVVERPATGVPDGVHRAIPPLHQLVL